MFEWDRINNDIKSCLLSPGLQAKIECLEKLIEKHGEDGMIYMALGDLYVKSKRLRESTLHVREGGKTLPARKIRRDGKGKDEGR